ncbi:hypothetical protein B0H14DRAFT_3538722 [Mycena olivaceomarginata]|nr:hypothetical protein B0H14DRAFT_3538722 [Mycena olivaceomarginata]
MSPRHAAANPHSERRGAPASKEGGRPNPFLVRAVGAFLHSSASSSPSITVDTAKDAYGTSPPPPSARAGSHSSGDVDCHAAALPIRRPFPDAAPLVCENRPYAAGLKLRSFPPDRVRPAPPTTYLPLPPFPRHPDACSGSRPSCPAVARIRPLNIFSFLPSTSGDAIRRLQRLVGVMRGCPALLQLRISLPPLAEVGRDGRVSCAAAACKIYRDCAKPTARAGAMSAEGVLGPFYASPSSTQ